MHGRGRREEGRTKKAGTGSKKGVGWRMEPMGVGRQKANGAAMVTHSMEGLKVKCGVAARRGKRRVREARRGAAGKAASFRRKKCRKKCRASARARARKMESASQAAQRVGKMPLKMLAQNACPPPSSQRAMRACGVRSVSPCAQRKMRRKASKKSACARGSKKQNAPPCQTKNLPQKHARPCAHMSRNVGKGSRRRETTPVK